MNNNFGTSSLLIAGSREWNEKRNHARSKMLDAISDPVKLAAIREKKEVDKPAESVTISKSEAIEMLKTMKGFARILQEKLK